MAPENAQEFPDLSQEICNTLLVEFGKYEHDVKHTPVKALAQTLKSHLTNNHPCPNFDEIRNIMAADGPMKELLTIDSGTLEQVIASTIATIENDFLVKVSVDDEEYIIPEDVIGFKVLDGTVRFQEKGKTGHRAVGEKEETRIEPGEQGTSMMEATSKSAPIDFTIGKVLSRVTRTIQAIVTPPKTKGRPKTDDEIALGTMLRTINATKQRAAEEKEAREKAAQKETVEPTVKIDMDGLKAVEVQIRLLLNDVIALNTNPDEPEIPAEKEKTTAKIRLFRAKKQAKSTDEAAN